jgi:hypothetical protein
MNAVKDLKTTITGIAGLILTLLQSQDISNIVNVSPGAAHATGIVAAVAMSLQLIFGAISAKKAVKQ